jgi:hypothetical protein
MLHLRGPWLCGIWLLAVLVLVIVQSQASSQTDASFWAVNRVDYGMDGGDVSWSMRGCGAGGRVMTELCMGVLGFGDLGFERLKAHM